jgi:putative NADH-flavin reductase
MNIVVFGASGRSGRLVVEQALEQGHAVTAFVRDLSAFSDVGARSPSALGKLRVVKGDALDAAAVSDAIEGQEAVVSAIGPRVKETPDICSVSIEHIIAGMKRHGAARLICITSSSDFQGFLFKQIMKPILLRQVYEDKERQEMQIFKSGLDWTIVRPGILQEGARTGRYRLAVSSMPKFGWRVSRADLAEFILRELKRRDYIRQSIAIAY